MVGITSTMGPIRCLASSESATLRIRSLLSHERGGAGGAVEQFDDREPYPCVLGLAVLRRQVHKAAPVIAAELSGQVGPAEAA